MIAHAAARACGPPFMKAGELFSHARRAALWSAAANWFDIIGATLSFFIMARLVGPEGFGVFGLALLMTLLPETVVGGALSEALIQRRELRPGHIAGAFWLQLGLALVFMTALAWLSPWLAHAFSAPHLEGLTLLLSATLLFMAVSAPPAALLQRELRFRAIAAVDAAGTTVAAVVGVGLGVAGFGVWALGWMEFARRFVRAVVFIIAAWRPHDLRVEKRDFVELAHFNGMTLATRLISQLDSAVPRLFLGMIEPRALGYFNLAQRVFAQSSALFVAPLNSAVLPLASRIQHQSERLREAIGGAQRLATLIAYPVFFGAAAIAPVLVAPLLGEAWVPATLAVQIMLLLGVRAASASFNGGMLRAVGKPGVQLGIVTAGLVVSAALAPLAAPWGAAAVAAVLLVRGAVTWLLSAWQVERAIGYPARRQFIVGWESFAAASLMAATVLGVRAWIGAAMSPWLLAPLLIGLGVVTHVAALSAFAPRTVLYLRDLAAAALKRDAPRLSALLASAPET